MLSITNLVIGPAVSSVDDIGTIPARLTFPIVGFIPTSEFADDDVSATRLHYKMTDTVCSGISVNYTPDNQYTSFKSYTGDMIQVPAIVLNLQFTEVKLLNQGDVRSGF